VETTAAERLAACLAAEAGTNEEVARQSLYEFVRRKS
jgi:hypothetical protein